MDLFHAALWRICLIFFEVSAILALVSIQLFHSDERRALSLKLQHWKRIRPPEYNSIKPYPELKTVICKFTLLMFSKVKTTWTLQKSFFTFPNYLHIFNQRNLTPSYFQILRISTKIIGIHYYYKLLAFIAFGKSLASPLISALK